MKLRRSVERIEIHCPFCMESTGRWKMVPVEWRPNSRGRLEPEVINNPNEIREFERKNLLIHIPNCQVLGACVNPATVLDLYHLRS